MKDKRKMFAINFGKSYFKSPPLQIPLMAIGLAVPIVVLLIAAVAAFGDPLMTSGMLFAPIPIAGVMRTDRLQELSAQVVRLEASIDAIKEKAKSENRQMTDEERSQWSELNKQYRAAIEEKKLEAEELENRSLADQTANAAIKPTLPIQDEMQKRYIHLPKKEERYANLGEFVFDAIQSDSRMAGKTTKKLSANMEMARASGMNETSPSDGGFLVQPDQSSRLIEPLFAQNGDAILSRVNTTNITVGDGTAFNAIAETTKATSTWGGIVMYWLGEGAEKTATAPKLRRVELKLKKIAGLCYLTDELIKDAPQLSSRLENGFRIALRSALIKAIIAGTGAGQPLGLKNSGAKIAITGSGGASTIVLDDILSMYERLTPGAVNPVWLYNKTCYKQLFQLQVGLGAAGALVSGQTIQSTGMQSMLGIPMVECPWCNVLGTEGDIILTDLSQYEFIQKGGPEVAYSIHVKFIYDETAMRIVYRCDGQPAVISATTLEDGTTTVSPIITLATRT
jgi:HK97 family phage major capsid protein